MNTNIFHTGTVSQLQHIQTNQNNTGVSVNTSDKRNSKQISSRGDRDKKTKREERTGEGKEQGLHLH